jgi:hypothetical protein
MWISWWGFGPFIWIVAKFSRIETRWWLARRELSLWKMMLSTIFSPEHHQIDKRSNFFGKAQILPEKLIQEWCWIVNHFVVEFCPPAFCFRVTSHPLTKHVFLLSLCCSESMRYLFQCVFWKKKLIELQHAKLRLVNPKKLKVFWLQKWLDAWKWDEVTKKIFSSHMNWTTHHVVKF